MRSWVDHPRAQTVPGTNSGSFAPRGYSPFFHASIAGLVPGSYPVHVGTLRTATERASQMPAAGPLRPDAGVRLDAVYVASDKIARLENPVSEEVVELLGIALENREARRLGEWVDAQGEAEAEAELMKYQVAGYQAVAYVNEVEHPGSTSVLVFDRNMIRDDAPAGGGFYVPGSEMER